MQIRFDKMKESLKKKKELETQKKTKNNNNMFDYKKLV
jgi:hypothetical protein